MTPGQYDFYTRKIELVQNDPRSEMPPEEEMNQQADDIKEAIRRLSERHPDHEGGFDLWRYVMPMVEVIRQEREV